jgi:hypothetical protein
MAIAAIKLPLGCFGKLIPQRLAFVRRDIGISIGTGSLIKELFSFSQIVEFHGAIIVWGFGVLTFM